jgi:hypothetical protein
LVAVAAPLLDGPSGYRAIPERSRRVIVDHACRATSPAYAM